jgi:hypothetical protein
MATPGMSEKELAALSGLQSKAEKYLRALRRTAWVQIFLALLTQVRHCLLIISHTSFHPYTMRFISSIM